MKNILKYHNYILTEQSKGGYCSEIDGEIIKFDTASQWKRFIDYKYGAKDKNVHRCEC